MNVLQQKVEKGALSGYPGLDGAGFVLAPAAGGGLLMGGDTKLYRLGAGIVATDGGIRAGAGYVAGGVAAYSAYASGDTAFRWQVINHGTMNWGPGNAPVDTTLARVGAGFLSLAGALQVAGAAGAAGFIFNPPSVSGNGFASYSSAGGDTAYRLYIDVNGKLFWGPGNGASDTTLARTGVNSLTASGALYSLGTSIGIGFVYQPATAIGNALASFSPGAGDTQYRFGIDINGRMTWGPGNVASDTAFFRAAAAHLRTTGALSASPASASAMAFGALVQAAANWGWYVDGTGKMYWGDGTNAVDTFLQRSNVNQLYTPGGFFAVGGFNALGMSAAGSTALASSVAADTFNRFALNANGQLNWGPGNAAPDTAMNRSGVGILTIVNKATAPQGFVLPAARVTRYSLGNQSIPASTSTPVVFDGTAAVDTSGFFSGAQPDRLTIPANMGGVYLVMGKITWAGTSGGFQKQALLRVNNAANQDLSNDAATDPIGVAKDQRVWSIQNLAPGDYVQLFAYQASAAAVALNVGGGFDTVGLTLIKIG